MRGLDTLRARCLAAMGLALAGTACPNEPPPATSSPRSTPTPSGTPAATATATATATAVSTEPTSSTTTTVDAPAPAVDAGAPPKRLALPPVPTTPAPAPWTVTFPSDKTEVDDWCTHTAEATCIRWDEGWRGKQQLLERGVPEGSTSKRFRECVPSRESKCPCSLHENRSCESGTIPCPAVLIESVTARQRAMHPGACCYANSPSCGMPGSGRALRSVDGSVAPPRPPRRESRSARPLPALATHWADVAAHEHASVSAFARTARELAALGAPHELVDRTKRAARDEVRHARVAFAIASAHAGERLAPSPRRRLPARPPTHETIAEEALVDGCFAETIGAVLLVATAERIDDDATREAVTRIAEDEMRHAELSFATLAWAVARGVELPEKRALSIVLEDTPYLSRVEAERIARAVVDELVRPCLERLRRQ